MPIELTWHTALILIADGFLFGVGFTIGGLVVTAVLGLLHR